MGGEIKAVEIIVDGRGIISCTDQPEIKVRFDLVGTQDFNDGLPGQTFCYGDLQFECDPNGREASNLLSWPSLILTGAGIQTDIHLNTLHTFTVLGAIRETN